MKKMFLILICSLISCISFSQIVMIGPMVNLNFEGKKVIASYAIEASYWNIKGFPYGVDAALEFQKGKFRIYSEAQTGIGIMGLSSGPFIEFAKGSKVRAGLQMTAWANYYIGLDLRMRFYKGKDQFAAGVYGKLPAYVGVEDENGDFDWWDWDDWD